MSDQKTSGSNQPPPQAPCPVCGALDHTAGFHDNLVEPAGFHDNSIQKAETAS
jgi:hypothetical protein